MQFNDEVRITLEAALRAGGVLHCTRSGAGVRMAIIRDSQGRDIAYGEHAYIHEALRIAADDYRAGTRPFDSVYGPLEPSYLTGSSTPADALDALVLHGTYFDARWENGVFVGDLLGLHQYAIPQDVVQRASAGETIRWTCDRGVTREARPARFDNGEPCCSVRVVAHPLSMHWTQADMWDARRRGTGPTLQAALDAALGAPVEDVSTPRTPDVAAS